MRATPRAVLVSAVCVVVAGCGQKRIAPPAEQKLSLGTKAATWRDYSRVNICAVEPRRVAGDVDSMNAVLMSLVSQTSAGTGGVWADEHIALLEQAEKELPAPLAAHEQALAALNKCSLGEKGGPTADSVRTGEELARQAKKRLAEAPELLAWAKARRDIEKWKETYPAALQSSKDQWCPPKPKAGAMPDIYFAAEDDKGRTEWVFCDGSRVVAVPGGKPEFVADPAAKKKPQPAKFLDAASKYPGDQVQRSPKLPEKKAAPSPEPEPSDEPG